MAVIALGHPAEKGGKPGYAEFSMYQSSDLSCQRNVRKTESSSILQECSTLSFHMT
jgi:hypothetical protein